MTWRDRRPCNFYRRFRSDHGKEALPSDGGPLFGGVVPLFLLGQRGAIKQVFEDWVPMEVGKPNIWKCADQIAPAR
jgi:hypothetical protein